MSQRVEASPTKAFFVKMLTRDIDLRDAILDLLDNCVDGIVRTKPAKAGDLTPYKGFYAHITATPDRFVIEDNCGGIPLEIAKNVAFRLGRPKGAHYERLETVGVYGIGMKRAIFKLGENAIVTSEHENSRFHVRIPHKWLDDDTVWDLEMEDDVSTGKSGTRVEITDLHSEIKRDFTPEATNFLTDLNGAIRQLYAIIMGKGFTVSLNGQHLSPIEFRLLVTGGENTTSAINPYVFRGRIGAVHIEVVVGFYRKPLSDTELEDENESPKADLSQAGWSVICNDRLVLRGDKSAITGWGTGNVPRFHNQFSSIAGIVTLRSKDPGLLPLNTTKRGIETSSDVYFRLLDYMRVGVKQFTDYTNRWKSRPDESKIQFEHAAPKAAAEIPDSLPKKSYIKVSAKKFASPDSEADEFTPDLPKPSNNLTDSRRIIFTRPLADIQLIADELMDDSNATPGQVGEACFDAQLSKIKKVSK